MERALIVIDVQNEYVTGRLPISHPNLDVSLPNIGQAMDAAQAHDVPIVVTQDTGAADDPIFAEGSDNWRLHEVVARRPRHHLVRKPLPGAFTGTDLDLWLRQHSIDTVSLAGYMSHHCIDTTARQALHAGFAVEILADATGTLALDNDGGTVSARQLHEVTLAVMHSRFAAVTTTNQWVAALASTTPLPHGNLLESVT